MEPVAWTALPGAGVVVRSGSVKVGTSVLHLTKLSLSSSFDKILMKSNDRNYHLKSNGQKIVIYLSTLITTYHRKRLPYLSPLITTYHHKRLPYLSPLITAYHRKRLLYLSPLITAYHRKRLPYLSPLITARDCHTYRRCRNTPLPKELLLY